MDKARIIKAVAVITVFSIITRALGFFFRIYLSWELGAELLGVYQVASAVLGVLMTMIGSGLPLALSKQTAIYNADNKHTNIWGSTSATLFISLGLALFICSVVFFFRDFFGAFFADTRCIIILLTLLPAVIFSVFHSVLRGTMWGQKKFFWVGLTELIEQIVRIIAFFVLALWLTKDWDGATNAGVSLSAGCFVSSIIVVVIYFAIGNKLGPPKNEYGKILKSATPVTGVRVAASLMQPLIAIIIPMQMVAGGYTSDIAMAEFGIAIGMTMPLLFLPSTLVGSLATVLLPELANNLAKNERSTASNQVQSAFAFSIFISMLIVPLYMGMSEDIGLFIYNNAKSGYYLLLSAWIMVPLSLSNISSTILNAMGLEGKSFKNYICGAFFLTVCCLVLTKYIGILSLIVGMGGCMIISTILNVAMIKKKIEIKSLLKPCLLLSVIAIPTFMLTSWTFNIIDLYVPKFFALAFCSILGAVVFIILSIVFKAFDIQKVVVEFKKQKTAKA